MNEMQLEINLNPVSGNTLRRTLETGEFLVLVETRVPAEEMDKTAAAHRLAAMEKAVLSQESGNTALAIVDNPARQDLKAVEYAAGLPEQTRDRHLVYLSGAGMDKEAVSELIQMAENTGLRNIVPVSGNIPAGTKSAKICKKIPFTESTTVLQMLAKRGNFFTGATVNPFQYTPYTLLGSYYKLIKKFNCGAGFMITQTGWDMLKLQSISWYLTRRDIHFPKIARLTLLSPEKVESIRAGQYPGIKISRDMNKLLVEELTYSKSLFESVQYRRLELQAAGCRLMGFSGIQISGIESPAKAEFILKRIQAALKEYSTFDHWLSEYNSFMATTEMAPFSNDYRMFDRILYRNYPYDDPPETKELPSPAVSFAEKIGFYLRRFLFSRADRQRAGNGRLLKKITANCAGCNTCRLPQKNFVCSQTCPLGLFNGICGNVNADGSCPVTEKECVHHKIIRLAHWRNNLPEQEKLLSE
ncbi:MAG: methylenetetrahydrofolate reductase C-terminal domain-containing protein [Lentisphaeria bacterium]|nr:methylenetetrahydrofolate reductase C-terminal domain-containing protein [Lentisphaeria bacterium]